jgi:hypothetical protein
MLNFQPGSLSVTNYYRQLQNATGTCGGPLPTNTVTVTTNPLLPVSVSVVPSANPVCAGASATFTATPVNGGTPSYQWFKNGASAGTGVTYSCIPVNGDQVYVIMTSNLACKTGSPATSNTVTMTVNPNLPVSVSITLSNNPVCAGTPVTYSPLPVNGGTPAYQWFRNSAAAGSGATFTCVPNEGEEVFAIMTSSLACKTGSPAQSNTVVSTVDPVLPVSVSIVSSENNVCAGTQVTPFISGFTTQLQWAPE